MSSKKEMMRRNIIIDIDSAFEIRGSGVSGSTIKCSICETVEDIPFYELEDDFYGFIRIFVGKHDHVEELKKDDTKENDLKKQFNLLEELVQECRNCDNQSIKPACFSACTKAQEFLLSLKKNSKDYGLSLNEIHDEAMRIKELMFNLKGKCYPVSNPNIAQLKDTMTFIRLLNHAVGVFETFGNCLRYTISKDDYYFLQICSKCSEITFHREHGKKTAHCVVCWKRNRKE